MNQINLDQNRFESILNQYESIWIRFNMDQNHVESIWIRIMLNQYGSESIWINMNQIKYESILNHELFFLSLTHSQHMFRHFFVLATISTHFNELIARFLLFHARIMQYRVEHHSRIGNNVAGIFEK